MRRLELLGSLEIGHPEIDDDHRRIIGLAEDLAASIEAGAHGRCSKLFGSFIAFCTEHFVREEQILAEARFPQTGEHARYHKELLARATAVERECTGLMGHPSLKGCFDELASFLIDDIVRGDSAFISHLIEAGYAVR